MSREMRVLHEGGRFFEGPRWHQGKWYVSDFHRRVVTSIDERGRAEKVVEVPGQPSGLGWLPDGSLLIVSMTDHRLLRRWPDGRVSEHVDLTAHCGGWANDMVVDGRGRAFVGNFGFALGRGAKPAPASLLRVDADGSTAVVADDLLFPNGSVVTPDGRTLIVGESFRNRYVAFAIAADGSLSDRRIWADLGATETRKAIVPDGCALDAEGCIWSADAASAIAIASRPAARSSSRSTCRTVSGRSRVPSAGATAIPCWSAPRSATSRLSNRTHSMVCS